jgi:hypothetical protein
MKGLLLTLTSSLKLLLLSIKIALPYPPKQAALRIRKIYPPRHRLHQ